MIASGSSSGIWGPGNWAPGNPTLTTRGAAFDGHRWRLAGVRPASQPGNAGLVWKSAWRAALALVAVLTSIKVGGAPLSAQEVVPPVQMAPSLANHLRWFDVRISSGRAVATSRHSGRSMNTSTRGLKHEERLDIDLTTGVPSIRYVHLSEDVQVCLDITSGEQLLLWRKSTLDEVLALELQQPADGPLILTIGSGQATRTVRATSLWQLYLCEPNICRTELTPLLELLRPGWHLNATAQGIEEALLEAATTHDDRRQFVWQALVNDLGNVDYGARQRADRELRGAGKELVPFLLGLDQQRLDAEQQFRVRRIVRTLVGKGDDDTPDRVITWLANDRKTWWSLLSREGELTRQVASAQLTRLLREPLDFDPLGPADVRAAQVRRLAERIENASRDEPRTGDTATPPIR